jgi:hypothetical protein
LAALSVAIGSCGKKKEKATLSISIKDSAATSQDFGTVSSGSTKSVVLMLSNSGKADASAIKETGLAAPFQFVGGSFPGTGGTCSDSLADGASCELAVEYAPSIDPYTTSSHTDTMIIEYQGGKSGSAQFELAGVADYCSQQQAVTALTHTAGTSALSFGAPTSVSAQSFTPASSMALSDVTMSLFKTAAYTVDNIVMRVRADNANAPGTEDLGTATISGSTVGTSWGDVTFRFATPVVLTGGVRYWFLLDPGTNNTVQNDNTYLLYFKGSFSDIWNGGEYRGGVDGVNSWNTFTYDLNFAMASCTVKDSVL